MVGGSEDKKSQKQTAPCKVSVEPGTPTVCLTARPDRVKLLDGAGMTSDIRAFCQHTLSKLILTFCFSFGQVVDIDPPPPAQEGSTRGPVQTLGTLLSNLSQDR